MRAVTPLCLAALGLALPLAGKAQDQFVVVESTYTANAQNTTDSHFRVAPAADAPTNWRAPIDYASGTAHARLEVLEKPSTQKTLYNICFEATPSYACMPYSPAYTAPGVYDFEYPFSSFYQYNSVDWSQGVIKVALILKDENGTKKQGDPAFYPTTIRLTLTIVKPGATYVPPADPLPDAGAPDGSAAIPDAGFAVSDAAVAAPEPAGTDSSVGDPWPMVPEPVGSAGSGGGAGTSPPIVAPAPSPVPSSAEPRRAAEVGGCAVVVGAARPGSRLPLLGLLLLAVYRVRSARPRANRRRVRTCP